MTSTLQDKQNSIKGLKIIRGKYACAWCETGFDWNEDSCRYGTFEGSKKDPCFCSKECFDNWIKLKTE